MLDLRTEAQFRQELAKAWAMNDSQAAYIKRLQSENTSLRLYAPARRAQPTVKSKQIAPTNWPAWGMIDETDEEFAERAGRKVAEVAP